MIDKLQISTNDFGVADSAILRIQPASYDSNEEPFDAGVLFEQAGRYKYGVKAWMNKPLFNLTIKPNFGMEVHFNPAVVMHSNNFHAVNQDEFRQSLDIIQNKLTDSGILFDMDTANITRLDIAQDREMDEFIQAYYQLFRMLQAKRAKPNEHDNGYYLGNSYRMALFYDKKQEMIDSKKDVSAIGDKNIMRCEYRLLKKDSVRRFAGFENVASIRQASFQDLSRFYQTSLADFVFTNIPAPDSYAYSTRTEIEILQEFKSRYKRNALALYHEARTNLQRFGSIENYKRSLIYAGYELSYVNRHIKKIVQCIAAIEQIESSAGKVNIGTLYSEVYNKFIVNAA